MGETQPPGYSASELQILVTPLSTSLSFLRRDVVEGEVHIKGLLPTDSGRSSLDQL